ncbi:hypothetical protein [Streptomyces endophyticus]|uniref:Uncharacterized protein n=1 Tax=Streptomyces endophyticus TaxID=714166 RepID=A0ABU6F694_9ACTN|nr:hypothetical protein [Streptomyces endophyticus]MEB8339536.1 hypothetical protein [Streptomyces endophyticus]
MSRTSAVIEHGTRHVRLLGTTARTTARTTAEPAAHPTAHRGQ